MSYTSKDFKSKKALKEAVAAGEKISVYNPGLGGSIDPNSKCVSLEGPKYPKPHTWYAQAELKDGVIVKVK